MTVQELIQKLQALPPDTPVCYMYFAGIRPLLTDDEFGTEDYNLGEIQLATDIGIVIEDDGNIILAIRDYEADDFTYTLDAYLKKSGDK